jgi:hypothetical protein
MMKISRAMMARMMRMVVSMALGYPLEMTVVRSTITLRSHDVVL